MDSLVSLGGNTNLPGCVLFSGYIESFSLTCFICCQPYGRQQEKSGLSDSLDT